MMTAVRFRVFDKEGSGKRFLGVGTESISDFNIGDHTEP